MGKLNELLHNLPTNLRAIVGGNFTREQLNQVIALSHAFAIVALKKKLSTGKLNLNLVHLDIHDIAYDCIAELFRMDGNLPLIQLKSYFAATDLEHSSSQALTDHLRRLTFHKVNQGIFRLYSEYDPSLGKILRNIKIAVQSLNSFIEVNRFGEIYLVPSFVNEKFSLPVAGNEVILQWLREILDGHERIPEVMAKLSLQVQNQHEYAKAVSYIGLGISLRVLFAEELEIPTQQAEYSNAQNAIDMITHACNTVQTKMAKQYVEKKKLTQIEYEAMFRVIQKNLAAKVIEQDGEDFSLFDHLKQELPEITKQEYRKKHKAIIEYLLSITKQKLGRELKRQL